MIDQTTSLGAYWTRLSRSIAVLPAEDLVVFGDGLQEGWQVTPGLKVDIDPEATAPTYRGSKALALRTDGNWRVTFRPAEPLDLFGYDAIQFAVHPGDVSGTILELTLTRSRMSLFSDDPADIRVDLEDRSWQVIEISLASMVEETLSRITFSGSLKGTFYLDDIRLVAAKPGGSPNTAVLEGRTAALPQSVALEQNYPNPFNSFTTIRFALPTASQVELAVFNLTGQPVVTLLSGARPAGTYTVRWDGRDDDGRELASGVYLYRLRAGDGKQVETRKLVRVR